MGTVPPSRTPAGTVFPTTLKELRRAGPPTSKESDFRQTDDGQVPTNGVGTSRRACPCRISHEMTMSMKSDMQVADIESMRLLRFGICFSPELIGGSLRYYWCF